MASFDDIAARVREITGKMSPLGERTATSDERLIEDLGYDSVTFMELSLALEGEFDINVIEEDAVADLATVGDVERLIGKVTGAAPQDA
ncbi:phosphopantetheine-binding protein [Streptomyces sp. NPDC050529]|uniref:phosphopantetheine-binding protein n=1 Tax=unclassified Streptomyces TaxID=2593676 RepID=UPI002DDBCA8D|nr:phosphopantetheine-binding protein [Streptomyces sp. NBC_01022]WRZ84561.1 phosphopantetheine-binding protein [Streptomyces sp. NBC_01022]